MPSDENGKREVKRTGGLHDFAYSQEDLDRIRTSDTDATRAFKRAYREWLDNPDKRKPPAPRFEEFVRDEPDRPQGGMIAVWVKTANGRPVPDYEVTLKHKGLEKHAVTNGTGVAEFPGLRKWEHYCVAIVANGKTIRKQAFLDGPRTTTEFFLQDKEYEDTPASGQVVNEKAKEMATTPDRYWNYVLLAATLTVIALAAWLVLHH